MPNLKKGVSGFTLVEMAIVLVIIGIILAGVMKGRDIVRGAQVKQFSQQFAQKWGTVAQTYYDKTGQILNDGEINGGIAAGAPNGKMDGLLAGSALKATRIMDTLDNVGIPVCSLVKSKLIDPVGAGTIVVAAAEVCTDGTDNVVNIWQTLVEGEYAGSQIITADLLNLQIDMQGKTLLRNCVILYNVPTDVAQGLDTAIDGLANGAAGSCVGWDPTDAGTAPTWLLGEGAAVIAEAWAPAIATGGAPQVQTTIIILDY
ncbi:MAG: prepilin-type N-terminal cleavage/methylation domain-containing protein [Proteobacteria bacterium]|nr:prepilin-type N-terminal cleavage/methylation domain-containing protein [Pseudomonadota bacterium]